MVTQLQYVLSLQFHKGRCYKPIIPLSQFSVVLPCARLAVSIGFPVDTYEQTLATWGQYKRKIFLKTRIQMFHSMTYPKVFNSRKIPYSQTMGQCGSCYGTFYTFFSIKKIFPTTTVLPTFIHMLSLYPGTHTCSV